MNYISQKHQRVCNLVLSGGCDGAEAYATVYGKQSKNSARASYAAMVRRPEVKKYMEEGQHEVIVAVQKKVVEVAVERAVDLVGSLQAMVDADPRELMEYRRGACRYCHGDGHLYQRTPNEHREALASYLRRLDGMTAAKRGAEPPFDEQGGVGYNRTQAPHPDCPECFGEGIGYTLIKDTRNVSAAAARLFAGVQETKAGARVKVRDNMRAHELLMRNRGLLDPKEPGGGAGTTAEEHAQAVRELLAQAGAKTNAPG